MTQKKILVGLMACIMLVSALFIVTANAGDIMSPIKVELVPRSNVDENGIVVVDVCFTGDNIKSVMISFDFDSDCVELLCGDDDNTYWESNTSSINNKMFLTAVGDGTQNDPPSLAFTEAVTLNKEKLLQLEFKVKSDITDDDIVTISVDEMAFGVVDASNGIEIVSNLEKNPELFVITNTVIKTKCSHTSTRTVSAKAATCCEKGTTVGVVCDDCGEIISGCEETEIDANNHVYYGAWGKYDKDNHVRTCGCGHKEYESHNWDNGVTANGVITFTCTTCGEKVTQTVRPDPTGSITVKNAKAFVGKTIAVDIVLADNPGFVNMQLKIEFDSSVFTLDSVTDGGILGTSMHTSRYESPYYLTWDNGSTATADITANGTIATLNFTVAADAPTGDYEIKVSYDYDDYGVVDFYLNPVSIATVDGFVTVTDVILGDVTGDGRVNTLDGMYLGRYLAKWPDFTAEKIDMDAADVNGDGKVNTLDGMILGRHLAKWPGYETLPFGKQ